MHLLRTHLNTLLFLVLLCIPAVHAAPREDISLLPKYGMQEKNEVQKAADARFLANMDEQFHGDRNAAAQAVAESGWQALRANDPVTAMRRYNQSWLLDAKNPRALWGMAALQGQVGRLDESLQLFAEAEPLARADIDFAVDQASTLGLAAAQSQEGEQKKARFEEAFARFAQAHERAPEHTLNLQKWAITLFYAADFNGAWSKIKLAEATPRAAELDQKFVAALQAKMPRP